MPVFDRQCHMSISWNICVYMSVVSDSNVGDCYIEVAVGRRIEHEWQRVLCQSARILLPVVIKKSEVKAIDKMEAHSEKEYDNIV